MNSTDTVVARNFIRQIIDNDLAQGRHQQIVTRFPPEPNGYLHIGHAKSICLNFGIARDYQGQCNLRFDDTNPAKEDQEFVESIQEDIRWLGFEWGEHRYYASNYFEQLYQFALELIDKGLAYVCDQTGEQMRHYRGTLTEPGQNSPYRDRSVAENRALFEQMRAGAFADGSRVLRAKIDMASPNINLRDPTLYRIRHGVIHHQTGSEWCLYPMYDYTHPISDALEGVTHSLCTLEFEDHRPLYDWVLNHITVPCHPRQIEFARLNLQYTVVSKRKLTQLVSEGHVDGWSDPRMPTLAGLRRRGYTPSSIRTFCDRIGVAKADNSVEMELLESTLRDDLNPIAPRRMAVLKPLKLVLTNYPDGEVEWLTAANHPQNEALGSRQIPWGREIWIDREDFMEVKPNKKFKRLVSGGEVRLRYGYVICCDEVIKDEHGEIIELRCRYDPATLGKNPADRKVAGVIHWVSVAHAVTAEVRLYDRLFARPNPDQVAEGGSFLDAINPDSLQKLASCYLEPSLAELSIGEVVQFEREGYFCRDSRHNERQVWNRTVTLRDSWAKMSGVGEPSLG
ncbi:glutamine--tRNA ligase/YqeY domain fusion protein [Ectothiorhodospiraceae bacterium BW-2]|nr:glutamine--tRNA ligase/YqeY domain fusion protein [Ectothiorhodospiraceae bacterium BW-2]